MKTIVIRFPDGTKEFRSPNEMLVEGDVIWHEGARFVVVSLGVDGGDKDIAVVEPEAPTVGDLLQSEEGAIRLAATHG